MGNLLNVNNRLSLRSSNKSAEGEVSKDDATFAFLHKLDVEWHKCKSGSGKAKSGKGKGKGTKDKRWPRLAFLLT